MKEQDLLINWPTPIDDVFILTQQLSSSENQEATNASFSDKWISYSKHETSEQRKLIDFQKAWFLDLYGYSNETEIRNALNDKSIIMDAGCGLGFKTAWFAELMPDKTIIGMDYSEAIFVARNKYKKKYSNIIFAKGDIADTRLPDNCIDFLVCDQVIMHTQDPQKTLKELSRILSDNGVLLCYWYTKKALPRELLDDYFRANVTKMSKSDLWKLSSQLTQLGKLLSELNITANFPHIPLLGIKGGEMDLQRFIYWNFIKCFWNEVTGEKNSELTNYDWYSPVNAKRFTKSEVFDDLLEAGLSQIFFREEEAAFSGRFEKKRV